MGWDLYKYHLQQHHVKVSIQQIFELSSLLVSPNFNHCRSLGTNMRNFNICQAFGLMRLLVVVILCSFHLTVFARVIDSKYSKLDVAVLNDSISNGKQIHAYLEIEQIPTDLLQSL